MRRALVAVSCAVPLVLSVSSARAQERLGEEHQVILSADRLIPLYSYTVDKEADLAGTRDSYAESRISLVSGPFSGNNPNGDPDMFNVFDVPRLSFDFTVIKGLTLGASAIVFFTVGGSHTHTNARTGVETSGDSNSYRLFGVAPRVGYILPLGNSNFYFWPRGGISFYSLNIKTAAGGGTFDSDTFTLWALDFEAPFAFSPVPHLAFTLGPDADIPLTGSHSSTPAGQGTLPSTDHSQLQIGVHFGLLAYF